MIKNDFIKISDHRWRSVTTVTEYFSKFPLCVSATREQRGRGKAGSEPAHGSGDRNSDRG